MNSLPLAIENMILDYKNQMEHKEKLNKSLKFIKNIGIIISNSGDFTYRTFGYKTVEYLNQEDYFISQTLHKNKDTFYYKRIEIEKNYKIEITREPIDEYEDEE